MCCDSGHKTPPVLTGGAYLHLGKMPRSPTGGCPGRNGAVWLHQPFLSDFGNPLDLCNRYLAQGYREKLAASMAGLDQLRKELNMAALGCCPVPVALSGPEQEPLKLTLDAAALGRTGQWLADQLRHCGIECEYADIRNVVLMFTPENPPEDMARVRAALLDLLSRPRGALLPEDIGPAFAELASQNKQVRSIRAAVLSPAERVPVEQALGRVCALPTVSLPAGDPHRGQR